MGVQFRNVATVGGSLWGRFGFSDVMTIFRALGAKVELHHAGIMDLDEFVRLPRKTRDILVAVIVPKTVEKVVYLSQRNQSTDFPVLSCSSCKESRRIRSSGGGNSSSGGSGTGSTSVLTELTDESISKFAEQVSEEIRFGSNVRSGAAYRKAVCRVLVKRALETWKGEQI